MSLSHQEPSLHVFVSGFGSPHLDHKLRILRNNMSIIERHPWSRIQYTICCYDDSDLSSIEKLSNVKIIRDRLIVGQFLEKYLVPDTDATGYTYLLCLLDDIELQDSVDFLYMMHYIDMFGFDIVSPSMTQDSKFQFRYMLHDDKNRVPIVNVTVALEYFCYFMRPCSYKRYYQHINGERNPWMWGVDMLLYKRIGLRLGLINHMNMKHWYKDESYAHRMDKNPEDGYNYVLETYNETTDSLANQPSILYVIVHASISREILASRNKMGLA